MKKVLSHLGVTLILAGVFTLIPMEFNEPITLVATQKVKTHIFEQINNGAVALRNARTELAAIPGMIQQQLYAGLKKNLPQITNSILELARTVNGLPALKADIEKTMATREIKIPLIAALTKMETTLPTLLGVLRSLEAAFIQTLEQEKQQIGTIQQRVTTAINSINNRDILNRDLPTRMDALGQFLRSFAI